MSKKSYKDQMVHGLQKLGPSMIPAIAIMPIAGLMQSLGIILTLPGVVSALPFLEIPAISLLASSLLKCGQFVMSNLHILFAMSIAAGYSNNDSCASLAAVVSFMTTNICIGSFLGITDEMVANEWTLYTNVFGVNTLSMGVFGGIIVGLMVAVLYSRFKDVKLPTALSFFSGRRFVPIISSLFSIILALVLCIVWPGVQNLLNSLNNIAGASMTNFLVYTFVGLLVINLLIPLGVHTIVWAAMAYQFGTWTNSAGEVFHGMYPIHFAQIADGAPLTYAAFVSCSYIVVSIMLAVATAIIITSKPENKTATKSQMIPGMISAFVCGISEPIVFTFVFQAFPLYIVYCVLVSLFGLLVPYFINFTVGTGAWGGIVDFVLYGPLQGNETWWKVIPADILVFAVSTVIFVFVIRKMNLKTPGRIDELEEEEVSEETMNETEKTAEILKALGGKENVLDIDACMTRLRVTLKDSGLLDKKALTSLGASGFLNIGKEVQIIFGTKAIIIKSMLQAFIEGKEIGAEQIRFREPVDVNMEEVVSVADGELLSLSKVNDKVFSEGMLGPGYAVIPENGRIVSPVAGKVYSVFPKKHAISIVSDLGKEVLIHMGIDTSKMETPPFDIKVKEGEIVSTGTILADMNIKKIEANGKDTTVCVIFTNISDSDVKLLCEGKVKKAQKDIIEFYEKQ